MKICITVGHSLLKNGRYTSASGYVNEYEYNKKLGKYLRDILKEEGHTVDLIICPEKKFSTSKQEYGYKIPKVNRGRYDLVVELHLNAFNKKAKGTEVLYLSNSGLKYAKRVSKKLATEFVGRGTKKRNNLYMLRDTNPTAIMVEAFFCDNKTDWNKAKSLGYYKMAKLIAEGIIGKDIKEKKKESNPKASSKKEDLFFRVVAGSYTSRDNAEDMMKKLKKNGYDSFLDAYRKDKKLYYRVVVGSFEKRVNAKEVEKDLKSKKYKCFIAVYEK